jgi:hypothetical protein
VLVLPWTFEALGPGVHDVVDMEELVLDVFHPERRAWRSAEEKLGCYEAPPSW